MEVVVQGAVSALGCLDDDGNYSPEPDCYETLRDLIRYLRTDGNTFVARRIIGERNVVENDLIPLIKVKQNDEQMFDIVLRLMVNLVQPTLVTFMGKPPEGLDQTKLCYQLEENLRKAKLAFADSDLFSILKAKLQKYFFETEWDDRTEEDRLVMERIAVLVLYILSISPSAHDEKRTALESNSHDRVVLAFLNSGIQDIFIHIASESQEKDFHLSALEIVGYVVKEHKPEDIVSAATGRSEEEKQKAEQELRDIFQKEQAKMTENKRRMMSSRHSRFAGTYWVEGLNSINKENKFFTAKPVMDVNKVSFLDERKRKVRVARNRTLCEGKEEQHLSSLELRMKLKDFLENFLAKSFNRLMRNVKQTALDNTRVSQKNSDILYFLVMRFFLKYCRLSKMSPKTVDSCLGVDAFHNIQLRIDQYLESAALQKKEGRPYGVRAQYAVTAYKELILFIQYMVDQCSSDDQEAARAVCKHIMSVEEYRELGISILKKFQPMTVSKTFLQELVLATHYYFRMMERSVKNGDLSSVLKRQKKRKEKKVSKRKEPRGPSKCACDVWPEERLDLIWAKTCEELSDIVMGLEEAADDQVAVDSILNCSDEEQQQFAMLRIQRALREKRAADAVGLYRLCRDIWYSEDIFGAKDIQPEEEFVELRSIFYSDLNEIADNLVKAEEEAHERFGTSEMVDDYDSEADEDDERGYETKEVAFDFDCYIARFAASDVIKWYLFLLADFEKNSAELNKGLVKMLHRIGFDLKMHCRLFQMSLFRVLQRVNEKIVVLSLEERKKSPYYELYTFGHHLLKRFFKRFEELGSPMAPEALFFKGHKEGHELEYGFGSFTHKEQESKILWTEELEDEVRALHAEWKDMDERPEGMDILDFIEGNLTRGRTRQQIQKKLKNLGLDSFGAKGTKGADKSFPIIAMKELLEYFNNMDDNSHLDLVDWLRTSMEEQGRGAFSRPKIIKQLAYAGVPYEKKKPQKAPRKSNKKDTFINDGEEEDEEPELEDDPIGPLSDEEDVGGDVARSPAPKDSDRDVPLADSDDEDGDMGIREGAPTSQATKRKILVDSDEEDVIVQKKRPDLEEEMEDRDSEETEATPLKQLDTNTDNSSDVRKSAKKRQRILSSDEESGAEEDSAPPAAQSARKARKVFDSDEDD